MVIAFTVTPVRVKKQLVEKSIEGNRLKEEKNLVGEGDDWLFEILQGHNHSWD